jgi:hypothetical protein
LQLYVGVSGATNNSLRPPGRSFQTHGAREIVQKLLLLVLLLVLSVLFVVLLGLLELIPLGGQTADTEELLLRSPFFCSFPASEAGAKSDMAAAADGSTRVGEQENAGK